MQGQQAAAPDPARKPLQSWKEIAGFLNVTVRTVQRWEKISGLPVYRQGTGAKARVFAYTDDLQAWSQAGGSRDAEAKISVPTPLYRRPLGLAAALVLGVSIVFLWRIVAVHPNLPATWKIEGSLLKILDENERLCWQYLLPPINAAAQSTTRDVVRIVDVDGDGRIETLVSVAPQEIAHEGGFLLCFEHDGVLRWKAKYGRPVTFGSRSFDPAFVGRFLPVAAGPERAPFLMSIAVHYLWYPCVVELRRPDTGEVVEEYWHPGAIYQYVLWDLDKDGRRELVFAALNNPGEGLGHMAVGALKIPMSQRPPHLGGNNYQFQPVTGGGESRYCLFPMPDVCDVAGMLPIPLRLDLVGDEQLVTIMPVAEGGIVYTLDRELKVIERRFSDNFAAVHNRFRKNGLLDHDLTEKEIAVLGKTITFEAAPDGNDPRLKELWKH
jgi:hypothetical protein